MTAEPEKERRLSTWTLPSLPCRTYLLYWLVIIHLVVAIMWTLFPALPNAPRFGRASNALASCFLALGSPRSACASATKE
jgi:hypothetical protein